VTIDGIDVAAYTVPTDEPESDGTFEWDSTTIVVVEVQAEGHAGLGYTYGNEAIATLIRKKLASLVTCVDPRAVWRAMSAALRNEGHGGHSMMAMSAIDVSLWDLKARVVGVPVVDLLGAARESVPIYGSGGFTSYTLDRIASQLRGWVDQGIPRVKMKVSRDPGADPARLDAARKAIGDDTELYVDANGALTRKAALDWAYRFHGEWNALWFEEPVSSDDEDGLRLVRDRGPAGMDIAAGEYGYVSGDFARLAGVVDCLQADVTRCGGFTGFLRVGALADAHNIDISGHCAPAISAHVLCAVPRVRHLEYFHDHVRVESMLFDGLLDPTGGALRVDRTRPGLGLELKRADAERWRVS
jgi:L-alanine-DL-glutamate epimerase-like enolase superfamily enzyme